MAEGRPSRKQPGASGVEGAGRELPPFARVHAWQIQAVRDVLVVGAVVALMWAGYALRAVTVPLLVALLLAYLVEPLVGRLCRHSRFKRSHVAAGLVAAIAAGLLVMLALVLPLLIGQTTAFIGDVQDGDLRARVARLEEFVPKALEEEFRSLLDALPAESTRALAGPESARVPGEGGAESEPLSADSGGGAGADGPRADDVRAIVREEVAREVERLREVSGSAHGEERSGQGMSAWIAIARRSVAAILSVLGAVVQIGLLLFLVPFYFFFFCVWYPEVLDFGRRLIPAKNRGRALELLGKMDGVVAGFVRGRILISMIMGMLLAIGWMICGVPYAIALGLVIGVFCAVPYLGSVGVPVAMAFLLLRQIELPEAERMAWWGILLWPTLVFAAVQIIEGYLLTPMIAGKATNLDPVTILVAVLAGGSVLGVYGMLLAIPLAACAKILFTDVLMPRIRAWARGEVEDPLPIDLG